MPKRYEYTIEVRNPKILGPDYRAILAAHGAAHVEQHHMMEKAFTAPFTVLRLPTPRDTKYLDAVKAYEPYDKILKPLPDTRRETVALGPTRERREPPSLCAGEQSQRRECLSDRPGAVGSTGRHSGIIRTSG